MLYEIKNLVKYRYLLLKSIQRARAYSSVVERIVDIDEVTGSIPVKPTRFLSRCNNRGTKISVPSNDGTKNKYCPAIMRDAKFSN